MMAACYTMDLYCDVKNESFDANGFAMDKMHSYSEFPHQFTGETFGECKKYAHQRGWVFKKDGTHLCPKHSGRGKKK